MIIVAVIFLLLFLLFAFVVFFGAPFVPTLDKRQATALDMLNLKKGQTLIDLGCGDGRVLIAAAKRGLQGIGYELSPITYLMACYKTRNYRNQIKIILGNFWHADISKGDGIFVFLLDKYMTKLDSKISAECTKPTKLVSYAFAIPGRKPSSKKGPLFLYRYTPKS